MKVKEVTLSGNRKGYCPHCGKAIEQSSSLKVCKFCKQPVEYTEIQALVEDIRKIILQPSLDKADIWHIKTDLDLIIKTEAMNLPEWVVKDTIYYVDRKRKDIYECKIVETVDKNTVRVVPTDRTNNTIPEIVTYGKDIGNTFFWILGNALGILSRY